MFDESIPFSGGSPVQVSSNMKTIKDCFRMSIPIILCLIVQKMQEVINLVMLGHCTHLDVQDLEAMIAGAGLGNATQNLLCLSIIYGLN